MDVRILGNALVVNPDKQLQGQPVGDVLEYKLRLPQLFRAELFRAKRVKQGKEVLIPESLVRAGHRIALLGGIEDGEEVPREQVDQAVVVERDRRGLPGPDVMYEDEHLLVVNKPAPLLVYPGSAADIDTLDGRVAQYYWESGLRRRIYHVHRLDRETTGAILYAKHAYSARALDSMLAEHHIHRHYIALVRGNLHPKQGVIANPIGRDRHVAGRYRVSTTGKPAVTKYQVLGTCRVANEPVTLVECQLQTGRTHQIRVHMSTRGYPVVGDRLYGGGEGIGPWRLATGHALHARLLSLRHPYTEQDIRVQAALPQAFRDVLVALGLDQTLNQAKE